MLRHLWLFGAVLFLCFFDGSYATAGENRKKAPQPSADAKDWRADIASALEKNLSVEFDEQPLNEVVEYLRKQTGVVLLADTRAMDDVGLAYDVPVSAKLSDMPLRSLLRHLLKEFDLTWTVRDGVLLITTPEEAECCMETEIYNVLDLIKLRDQAAPDEYDYDSIINLITTTAEPHSWDTVGGWGSAEAFRGGVVITQTRDVHDQIVDMLAVLRKAKEIAEGHTDKAPPTACVDPYADDPAVVKIERALEGSLTFKFTETPLHDVAEFVADKCEINVVLDRRAMDDVGLGVDVPITFSAENMRVRHALVHILKDFELTSLCRDHALLITTPEEAESILANRVYPIADLVGESVGTDLFGDPQRLWGHDHVIELVTSIVAPETWDCVGGPGSIESCRHIDVLIVSQTPDVHERIVELLGRIRQHLAKCEDSPAVAEGTRKPDTTRLVIYNVPTAESNIIAPRPATPQPKAGVGQKEESVDGGSGLAQFGGISTTGIGGGVPAYQIASPGIQILIPEDELLSLITDLIEPDSWQEREDVYAKAVPGSLIIRHTDAVHRQIRQLLGRLNALRQLPGGFIGGMGGMGGMGGCLF